MSNLIKAICLIPGEGVKLQHVPQPTRAEPEHLIIKMDYCAINPGDKAFITRPLPLGAVMGLQNVYGVSGAGTVIATGTGVPEIYKGKKVAVYRSLKASESTMGTWCGYAHMHYLTALILPDDAALKDYSGSLVNAITPYAFLKQAEEEGHKAIISTAGTSATGIAMVGVCLAYNFPLISIARNEAAKKELENLGAKHVVVQQDADFKTQLQSLSGQLSATVIFDGVGGEILNEMIDAIPNFSTIYSYGYLGGGTPFTFHTSILNAKALTIKSFGNFRTKTVQNPQSLAQALEDLAGFFDMPHFKTKTAKKFGLAEIDMAVNFSGENGAKAVLTF